MLATPDQQISFTDPDSRSMATSGRGSGMVGYNVPAAVDTTNFGIKPLLAELRACEVCPVVRREPAMVAQHRLRLHPD